MAVATVAAAIVEPEHALTKPIDNLFSRAHEISRWVKCWQSYALCAGPRPDVLEAECGFRKLVGFRGTPYPSRRTASS